MALDIWVVVAAKAVASAPRQWTVNVSVEGTLVSRDVSLTNPINSEQEKGLKWYLETYAKNSPYSSTASARSAIADYARAICDELLLDRVIPRKKSGKRVTTVSLEILDESPEPQAKSTIHQLHWELLEHPDVLGEGGPRILIRRSLPVAEPAPKALHRITTWSNTDTGVSSINILLVVARDLTPNSATYNDISPWTAFDVLAGVKRRLASQGSLIRLNIEIVRPGTLKAFQAHLEKSREQYGPGYFHIIHFDLHGNVGKDDIGYLHFNSTDKDKTDKTVEVPAVRVATFLKNYKVPWAVLNACESARANAGDDANIAGIFRSRGVRNVLAMSYKISASAAEIFLQAFYRSLLTQGTTFSVAARSGRDALRLSPQRGARFRLTRDLVDWFVPVLYSSREEAVVQRSNQENVPNPQPDPQFSENRQPLEETASLGLQLQGRDFDLLRLEKMLLQQKLIFLQGPSGGGKSVLLRYARDLWIQTGFLDAVVYLDFRESMKASTQAAVEDIILNQLYGEKDATGGETRAASSWDKVTKILQDRTAAIIVDNMNAALTVLGSHKDKLNGPHAYDVLSVCRKLVEFASKNTCYLIFADCRERFKVTLTKRTGHKFERGLNTYKLSGLELSAATELAYTILKRVGVDTSEWKSPDRTQLQLVLEALQCLPDALNKILPLAKTCDTPWSSFYTTLICNTHKVAKHIPAKESCAVWDVIGWVRQVQPSGVFSCLILLGAFWYEAPDEDYLKVTEIAKWVGSDRSLCTAVVLAIDRGLIAENGQQGFWVHPLFTVFARTWELWDRPTPTFERAWFQGMAKLVFSWVSPDYWFIRALCEPSMDRIKNNPKEKKFLIWFMRSVEAQYASEKLVECLKGADYQDMVLTYPTRLPNLLTFIRICRGAGESLQLEQWPQEFLADSTNNIRMTGRVPEMALFAQEYESLLNDVICRLAPKGSKAIPSKHVPFVLLIANYLASTYVSDVRLPNDRSEEFVTLALEIGDQSEPAGGFEDPMTIYLRGLTYRKKVLLATKQARRDNVEESISAIQKYWELSNKCDKRFIDALDKAHEEAQQPSAIGCFDIPDKLKALQSKVAAMPILRVHAEARKKYSAFIDAIIMQLRRKETNAAKEMIKALPGLSEGLKGVHTAMKDFGYQNLTAQTSWAPPKLDMVKFCRTVGTEKDKLNQLANALDVGDICMAAEAHGSLALLALEKNDFDEAMVHLDSMEEIYAGDPRYSKHPEGQKARANRSFRVAMDALSDGSVESAAAVLKHNEQVVAAMKAQEFPELEGAIRAVEIGGQLWKQGLERNPSSLAVSSRDLGARIRKFQREFQKLIMENYSKPEEVQRNSQLGQEIQTSYLKRSKAQDDDDEDEELKIIAHQLQLTQTDFGKVAREFPNPEELKRDQEYIKLRRDWKGLMADMNFLEARMRLKLASERDSAATLETLWEVTEKIQLTTEMAEAEEEAKSDPPSVLRYDKLLDMHASGEFSHLDQTGLASSIKVIRHNRSWALFGAAFQTEDWETAITCLDECLVSYDLRANTREYDDIIDTKETFELLLHTNELERKDREYDHGDAQRHIDALRRFVEQRRTSPEVRRILPAKMWTPELVDRAQSQLDWKRMIIPTIRQENGKAFILCVETGAWVSMTV